MEKKIVEFRTFKKINTEALIYGLPFTIFFGVIMWIIVSISILSFVPFKLKIIWGIIAITGVLVILIVYQKYGLKIFLKGFELYFKNITLITFNEPLVINKIKLKKDK